jgi:uncharacterized protein YheU (UPF0270 family)
MGSVDEQLKEIRRGFLRAEAIACQLEIFVLREGTPAGDLAPLVDLCRRLAEIYEQITCAVSDRLEDKSEIPP